MLISISRKQSKKLFDPVEVDMPMLASVILNDSYSLATFRSNHRTIENFEQTELIGLDVDDGLSLAEAQELFKNHKHIIATSKSHQKSKHGVVCDRFRVILFLAKPVTDSDTFYATWHKLKAQYTFIDKACKDPARFWFPSGEIISIAAQSDKLLIDPAKPMKQLNPASASTSPALQPNRKGSLSQSTVQFISFGAPAGEWNHSLYKAAKDMQQQLYTQDEAERMLENATRLPGNLGRLDASDVQTIKSAFNSDAKYAPRYDDRSETIKLITQCNLIIDLADNQNTHLVNLSTGERFYAARSSIREILGQKEFTKFLESKAIYANFLYQPYENTILFKQLNGFIGYNMYTPPPWFHKEFYAGIPAPNEPEIPPVMKSFLDHLVDNHTDSLDYLLDWLATSMRSRNYTMLTAIGEQGIGKGILGEVMRKLLGDSNFVQTRDEIFKKSFNSQLQSKRLVYVDELALTKKESHDRLKHMVNDTLEVEAKGKDSVYIQNYASFYLSSNHLDAIKLQPGDRRFSIIQLTDEKILNKFSRNHIEHGILGDSTIKKFGQFLLNRQVDRDMRIPFKSDRFDEVMDAGLTNWQRYVLEQLAPKHKTKPLDLKELKKLLQLEFPMLTPPGRSKIIALCKSYPEKLNYRRKGNEHLLEFK